MLTKLRALLMTAVMWALTWSVWGALVAGVGYALDLQFPFAFRAHSVWYLVFRSALVGAWGGAVFAIILGLAYRSKKFADLSAAKLAFWGTLAGLLFPAIGGVLPLDDQADVPTPLVKILAAAVLLYLVPGFLTAFGMIKLARKSTSDPSSRPAASEVS